MTASVSLRVYTGANAATESAAQTGIALLSVDAATVDPASHQVAPGANSFEKWIRLRFDTAPTVGATNFYVLAAAALPAGVSVLFGVTDTPTTPTDAKSTVATMDLTSGRRFIFDANTYAASGQHTRYLVIQEQVAASAASGAIPQGTFTFGWQES